MFQNNIKITVRKFRRFFSRKSNKFLVVKFQNICEFITVIRMFQIVALDSDNLLLGVHIFLDIFNASHSFIEYFQFRILFQISLDELL